ncbi:hypothetical protein [Pantoea phage LIMEzero]|uniref:Uncharacterized protein n=1 Tax=Pantoea phage LIMEzero TaxID=943335 RepID=F4N9R0_9CAUD|nr:hypothetical protein LIMEzero_ORF07 [Pantoea phage LIMEzero]CBY88538.1 hypothetical protein [Pantoea phage LIMEzero]
MKATVQTVSVTNINAAAFEDGVASEHALIGQLLTREDGERRFVILGMNVDGDSDEKVVESTPEEVVPAFAVSLGVYDMVGGDLLEGADIRVLADLPSINVA